MFVIRFTDPQGVVSYWPKGFGYTAHEYAENANAAEQFETREAAQRRLNGYTHPRYFWECERRHAKAMEAKLRGWKYAVAPIASAEPT